jgi:hypothetical protein
MHAKGPLGTALVAAALLTSPLAHAYCRTTTCDTTMDSCPVDPETGCVTSGAPLQWPVQCIGFDLQQNASARVSLADATTVAHRAFGAWQNALCPGTQDHPSLTFFDLGPVACDQHEYNQDQSNANIIMFRDDAWPYTNSANTLALTTVTFNVDDGEIYDADMEVNGTVPLTTSLPAQYDLQSIMTHEAGHFLGLAHSLDPSATMFAKYTAGETELRTLSADDISAICEVYPPNREATSCNPEPRHGFASTCALAAEPRSGCQIGAGPVGPSKRAGCILGVAVALGAVRRRRRQRA